MKKATPFLGVAALGMLLAWAANARFQNPGQPPVQPAAQQPQNAVEQSEPTQSKSAPQAPLKAPPVQTNLAKTKGIQWQPSLEAAFAEAERTGKPIMADFYADWCGPCHILDKAYEQPNLIAESRKWVPVKIDIDKNHYAMQTYDAGSLPTIVFFGSDGQEVGRKVGFAVPEGTKSMDALVKYLSNDVIKSMRFSIANPQRKTSL